MAATKEVYDLVRDCSEPDAKYVRGRLANPDDEFEHALGSMTAEEVVQYLKDAYWNSQELSASIEQENADVGAHLAAEEQKQSDDARREVAALIDRLRK